MSKSDLVSGVFNHRLRSAGEAFRSGYLSPRYRAKPLLPGLAVQIEIHKERLRPRTDRFIRILDKTDNAHVRSIIGSQLQYLTSLCHSPTAYTPMSIFGQFSGPGFTQSGYAVHRLKSPLLFIDKIMIHDTLEIVQCPNRITDMLESPLAIRGSFYRVLPWISELFNIEHEQCRSQIQQALSDISESDPYIQSTFGVEGSGEGMIFFPDLPFVSCQEYLQLAFTACITRSWNLYSTLSQRIGPELARKIQNFIHAHVTTELLEESSANVVLDKLNTRQVMTSVVERIREKQALLQTYDFPQAEMEHAVGRTTAEWFIQKCNRI